MFDFCSLLFQMVQAIQVLRFHLLELEKVSHAPHLSHSKVVYMFWFRKKKIIQIYGDKKIYDDGSQRQGGKFFQW